MTGSIVIPCLTYKDANAAVEWLCRAFGLQERAVHRDAGGQVVHGELVYGSGLIMIGPDRKGSLSAYMATPERTGGLCTQTIYIIVDDPDAHYARAKSEGAEILLEPTDKDYGGRDYSCRDLEGNIWSFGTYNPWTVGGSA
jgi:uncharacterized glyoxalase superfamily protein PhnB